MNILFCALNGVLCTHKHNLKIFKGTNKIPSYNIDCIFDPDSLELLNKYCLDNKINLVILSSWAKTLDTKKGLDLLKSKGIKPPILSIEPFFMESKIDDVVTNWLNDNKNNWLSEIKWNAIVSYVHDGKLFDISKQIDKPVVSCSYNGINKDVLDKLIY